MIGLLVHINVMVTTDFNMGKPKLPKTRMREYRARIKENKDVCLSYLEKDKERKQMERGMEKQFSLSANVIQHRCALHRERVASKSDNPTSLKLFPTINKGIMHLGGPTVESHIIL